MNENDKSIEEKIARLIDQNQKIYIHSFIGDICAKEILTLFQMKVECSECGGFGGTGCLKCLKDKVGMSDCEGCPACSNCKGTGTETVPFKRGVKGVCL